ncbi:MAG TPA: hypothetical protein VI248_01980 [Kineosporiaceae bacterium]
MDAAWTVVVLVVFLAIVVTAGGGAVRTQRRTRAHRPPHQEVRIAEDTNPDDIADDSTLSRSDD